MTVSAGSSTRWIVYALSLIDDDPMVIDHRVSSQKPIQDLGRVVIQKGPASPVHVDENLAMPQGMRATLGGLHHVALMRNAELVVKYLRGPEATTGRYGYCRRVPMLARH